MSAEHQLQNDILCLGIGDVRLLRINSGVAWQGDRKKFVDRSLVLSNPRKIILAPKGTADILGLRAVTVTPEMVGKRIAQFVALEVKAGSEPSPAQERFLETVTKLGAVGAFVASVSEAKSALSERP